MQKNAENWKLHIDKFGLQNANFHRNIINKCGMRNAALPIDKCEMRKTEKCGMWKSIEALISAECRIWHDI